MSRFALFLKSVESFNLKPSERLDFNMRDTVYTESEESGDSEEKTGKKAQVEM